MAPVRPSSRIRCTSGTRPPPPAARTARPRPWGPPGPPGRRPAARRRAEPGRRQSSGPGGPRHWLVREGRVHRPRDGAVDRRRAADLAAERGAGRGGELPGRRAGNPREGGGVLLFRAGPAAPPATAAPFARRSSRPRWPARTRPPSSSTEGDRGSPPGTRAASRRLRQQAQDDGALVPLVPLGPHPGTHHRATLVALPNPKPSPRPRLHPPPPPPPQDPRLPLGMVPGPPPLPAAAGAGAGRGGGRARCGGGGAPSPGRGGAAAGAGTPSRAGRPAPQ